MLAPKIAQRVDRLLAMQEKQYLSQQEFDLHLGDLATADNVKDLIDYLPPEQAGGLKSAVSVDERRATYNECLHVEESPLDDMANRYHRIVGELLLEATEARHRVRASVVCLPSFAVEWGLRLLGSEKTGFTLALNVAEVQIWGSETSPVPVRRIVAPFSVDMAEGICDTWRKMLLRVRNPEMGMVGTDGIGYHFSCRRMAGKTWSPDKESAPGKLVALGHLLADYVESDYSRRVAVADDIRKHVDWFKELS